ncbi:MAG: ribulose-phosphate 3-epimerase [Oscillospiraceae bacterium]
MNIISPSILSADFANLEKDIKKVSNAQMLHIDVMDGHFVPNISIGVPVVQSLNKVTNMFLDVHLMISDPIKYVDAFSGAGADLICFHYESNSDVDKTISAIKKNGKKVGLAIKPNTDVQSILKYLPQIDMVLVMTVEPGFGGQSFMPLMMDKVKFLRKYTSENNIPMDIQVDGGINLETAIIAVKAGANVLVAGSFVFGNDNPEDAVYKLMKCI